MSQGNTTPHVAAACLWQGINLAAAAACCNSLVITRETYAVSHVTSRPALNYYAMDAVPCTVCSAVHCLQCTASDGKLDNRDVLADGLAFYLHCRRDRQTSSAVKLTGLVSWHVM
jgi:hypothetical protein